MLDAENPAENQAAENNPETSAPAETASAPAKRAAAKKTAAKKTAAKKATAKKTTTKKAAAKKTAPAEPGTGDAAAPETPAESSAESSAEAPVGAKKAAAKRSTAKKATARKAAAKKTAAASEGAGTTDAGTTDAAPEPGTAKATASPPPATTLLFQPPDPTTATPRRKKAEPKPDAEPTQDDRGGDRADSAGDAQPKARKQTAKRSPAQGKQKPEEQEEPAPADEARDQDSDDDSDTDEGGNRRRRRRGGRRRRKSGENDSDNGSDTDTKDDDKSEADVKTVSDEDSSEGGSPSSRRRRRRRRTGDDGDTGSDDPANTVTRVRKTRTAEDEITALSGSTRLEAKKQRRREGREAGRRRAPIVSEAEFLARREAVERVMVIRQKKDLTQIAVLEDKVLVEHYVARESQSSLIGNVYLGRVQNVLPSMEAAFIDIGKGRNAVLYAGEVNWDSLGAKNGQARKIESVLKSGQSVLVQVSKDPIGHKGARLTSQISLPGRFLVYVPDGTTSGISRKLPDTERTRLKTLLKEIVPDTAGVIVRTAAEGASEEELTRDVERLKARWEDIESKVSGGNAPQLLYGEPDLTLKVVRDLFTEDFDKLVVSGDDAWDMVDDYVKHLAPDLEERLENYSGGEDVFAAYRIDEQIAKGLDRKVWLPSGGSLVIDRTEAMTVVDVNTGKFTGSGGNLEETVTKNNLEAAEEIVRQLRLRDIGGIIVVDFIDMVLESNRDLVLRRMVECLGRDRTRHQVAEVTSLGLVQMTRKRIGTGLLEAFSDSCEHCGGRGLIVHHEPVEPKKKQDEEPRRDRRSGRSRGRDDSSDGSGGTGNGSTPTPKDLAAMAKTDRKPDEQSDRSADQQSDGRPEADGAAPQKSTTSGRRRGAKRDQPALIDDADEGATDLDAGEPTVADKPVAEEAVPDSGRAVSQPETELPPAAKKATTTRKRSARRAQGPAGEPSVVSADELVSAQAAPVNAASVEVAPTPGSAPVGEAAPAVEAGPAGEAGPAAATEPVAQAAPTVVATVRRRGAARRPAGPPTGARATDGATDGATPTAESGADPVSDAGAGGGGSDAGEQLPADGQEQAAPAHVPVKKKGSRKR